MIFSFVRRAYEKKISDAQGEFINAYKEYEYALIKHRKILEDYKKIHADAKEKYLRMAAELFSTIDQFEKQYRSGGTDSVRDYCSMVLERSEYPEDIQPDFIVDYESPSRNITVRMLMPGAAIIPAVASYTYVKSRDAIDKKLRKPKEIAELYHRLLAEMALRTIHEIVEADQGGFVDAITFSGYLDSKKGKPDSVTASEIISLSVTKSRFLKIDLEAVMPVEAIKELGGKFLRI
jgi:restriction system protein